MEIMHKASSSLSCKISFFPSPDNIDSPRTLATPFRHSSASSNSQQLQLQLNRSKNHRPALSPLRCTVMIKLNLSYILLVYQANIVHYNEETLKNMHNSTDAMSQRVSVIK
ncbi:hypothetical protein CFP56_041261 [Quercus suber]|uniref:Uncharacterized protein n=1 Tax=Quercus suber TaxID=58331 RepID=A0AAW0LMH5_QUESU